MTSVLIADDQPLVRSGIRTILESEPDIEVVGEASNGSEAFRATLELHPDVVLLDVRMPESDGLAVVEAIVEATPTRVLMLTTFDLDEYVYRAMRSGAAGFLLKDMSAEEIVHAVRQSALGVDAVLAPVLTRRLLDQFTSAPPPSAPTEFAQLTDRELDVLRLIGRGLTNGEIGRQLFISETTVKTHVSRVLMKLGLRDRVHAAIAAADAGLR